MFGRQERHTGAVGDVYALDAEAATYSKTRRGNGDNTELQGGDRLVRTAHSGDCFSYYAVFRDGKHIGRWCGYDGVGEPVGNLVDLIVASGVLPEFGS